MTTNRFNRFKDLIKQIKEERNLQEISSDLAYSYKHKADAQLNAKKKPGPPSKAVKHVLAKRTKGVELAGKTIKRENAKEWAAEKAKQSEVHDHIQKSIPSVLAHHGYTKLVSHPKQDVYVKAHPKHVSTVTHHKHSGSDERARDRDHITHSTSMNYSSSGARFSNYKAGNDGWSNTKHSIDDRKKHSIEKLHKHLEDAHKDSEQHAERDY